MSHIKRLVISAGLLERGEPLPLEIRCWLARGFRNYLAGRGRLDALLGVRVRQGGRFETPDALSRHRRRDDWIASLAVNIPGSRMERAAYLSGILKGHSTAEWLTAEQLADFRKQFPNAPRSARQLCRILAGEPIHNKP